MMLWFRYLLYTFRATTHHGVHSPFIFSLITHCFYNRAWRSRTFFPYSEKKYKQLTLLFKAQINSWLAAHKLDYQLEILEFNNQIKPITTTLKSQNRPRIVCYTHLHKHRKKWEEYLKNNPGILIDFYFWGCQIERDIQVNQIFYLKIL